MITSLLKLNINKSRGFTLVELLIVIAIIAILAVVGVTVFSGVQKSARDSKRKADIESIAKAYELKYNNTGSYQAVADTDFASGAKPKESTTVDYYNNLGSSNSSFRICAALESNPSRTCSAPSTNCYCLSSAQGSYSSGGSGGSIDHPVSCDPNGTLGLGLVGYWNFNEGTGTTANDISGSGNTGTLGGGTASYQPTWTSGKIGAALNFDGLNDIVQIANESNFDFINSFTIAAWIKPIGSDTYNGIVGKYVGAATGWDFILTNGQSRMAVRGSSSIDTSPVGSNLRDANWHYAVVVVNGTSSINTYIDGQSVNTTSGTWIPVTNDGNVKIGGRNNAPDLPFGGLIDDVKVYNRALSGGFSDSEITHLYNNGNGCAP